MQVRVVAVAIPFATSLRPSARARALGAPVEVDIGKLEEGALMKVEWRGKPVYILNRSAAALEMQPSITIRKVDGLFMVTRGRPWSDFIPTGQVPGSLENTVSRRECKWIR